MAKSPIRMAAIGLNHGHIYGQTRLMLDAGAELVSYFAKEPELAAAYGAAYPQAQLARSEEEILEDESIQLILTAGIPAERASLGVRAMRHGKDFMSDKGAPTTFEQLEEVKRVQKETGRIYSVCFSERFEVPAVVKAQELVAQGAIGRVVQTVGLGPHRVGLHNRPDWFFRKASYGGILIDIASHQFDQFLYFTQSTEARVTGAHVANYSHLQYPEFEDFGEVMLEGSGGTGYIRVDWYTPDGLGVWGDGRLTILGTEGYIEIRKYVDLLGRPGDNHLFLVTQKDKQYIDCANVPLKYGGLLSADILNRTETAMPQAHCFKALELALQAEQAARRLGNLA
ncbi:MAG: Gfo/Idh/MocA family oxidoreductase [Anaerolineae bacterium]|nr:Gfo/Idh/MocA family oxidoreductase [Anaerolineae bacterium]